jgi:hypothetical protein
MGGSKLRRVYASARKVVNPIRGSLSGLGSITCKSAQAGAPLVVQLKI